MKKILTILMTAGAFAACQTSDDNGPVTPDAARVTISPVITRALETSFESGDRIGLTIRQGETDYATNALLTYADNVFAGSLTWYTVSETTSTLTAYYPYDQAGAPTTFTVQTDQNTGRNYTNSDLMASSKSDVTPSDNAISMPFKHLFTKILIETVNTSGSAISEVILQGSVPTAAVDIAAQTVTVAEAAAADIKAQQAEADKTYRAIVIPQTVAFTLTVKTADGKEWSTPLASATLVKGGQYTVNAAVTPEGLKVSLTGEIENWGDEGVIPPATDEVPFEEFPAENYFMYDGERYSTVTLSNGTTWMAEAMRYIPDGLTPSADATADAHIWYPYKLTLKDGATSINDTTSEALTDAESVKAKGYLYDFYAALGKKEVTVENCNDFEGAQGICPKGWHIPTRAELFDLCGLSNKAAEGETGNQTNESALFYDANYTGGNMALFNAAGWNYPLSGTRLQSNFTSAPSYQSSIICDRNTVEGTTPAAYFGQPALTYIMTSTCYKPIYSTSNPDELTNIQFFAQMTTFTTKYPEGRINLAYIGIKSGVQLRCVKDKAQ